jgi:hypothetical protein
MRLAAEEFILLSIILFKKTDLGSNMRIDNIINLKN